MNLKLQLKSNMRLSLNIVKVFIFLISFLNNAQEVHVYKTGGSYNSVTDALQAVSNGGTIVVHEGTYYENVVINNIQASEGNPLIIKANPGDNVVFDGTDTIETSWTTYAGNPTILESDPINRDIWQLFVNNTMQINARWPNADHPFDDFENSSWWDRHISWCKANADGSGFEDVGGVKRGWIQEDGAQDMAATNIDFNGKVAVLNVNSMESYAGFVKDHVAGTNNFEYDLHPDVLNGINTNNVATIHKNRKHAYFFFENGLDLLDTPGEWYYDKTTKKIYVYPLNGANLSTAIIKWKSQKFAFEVSNSKNVHIVGLQFFATTVSFVDCFKSKIEDCVMEYASYSKRILDNIDVIPHTQMVMTNIDKINPLSNPTNNLFINNEVFNTDGMALQMTRGVLDTIYNNYFHKIDISGTRGGSIGVDYRSGFYTAFIRNTFEKGGGSAATKGANFPYNKLNRLSEWGFIQDDGVAFQVANGGQIGSVTTQNWIHNSIKAGMRFDGPEDTDPHIQGKMLQGAFVRNVVWDNPLGYMVKGDDHRVYNNVAFNNSSTGAKILASTAHDNGNTHTITRNNLMDDMSGSRNGDQFTDPVPGIVDHNWLSIPSEYNVFKVLRDPYNLDFRPKSEEVIDKGIDIPEEIFANSGAVIPDFTSDFKIGDAPDIGAYEDGATYYWIPGRQQPMASTPIPPNNTTSAQIEADLMWLPAYKSTSNKVYFGTETGNLQLVAKQSNNLHYLDNLNPGQDYYWRVDCLVDGNWVMGELWTFKPNGAPYKDCGTRVSMVDEFATPLGLEDYDAPSWKPGGSMLGEVHLFEDQLLIQPDFIATGDATIWNSNGMRVTAELKVKNYPFVKFDYYAPKRTSDFTFAIQVIENGAKSKRSGSKVIIEPSIDGMTSKIISIQPMIDKWEENNDGWNSLKEFNITINPDGSWVAADDGDLFIDNFKVGFEAIKDEINKPTIAGQETIVLDPESSFNIDQDVLNIKVEYDGIEYDLPKCESPFDNWELKVKDGEGYNRSGTVITPEIGYNTIQVPVTLSVDGIETPEFMLEVEVNQPLGIEGLNKHSSSIYPNPTNGLVHIRTNAEIAIVKIYDVQGKLLYHQTPINKMLDLNTFPTGLYLVNIFTKEGDLLQEKLLKR